MSSFWSFSQTPFARCKALGQSRGWNGRIRSRAGIWSFLPFYSQFFHTFGILGLQIMLSIRFCVEFTFPMLLFLMVWARGGGGTHRNLSRSPATLLTLLSANWNFWLDFLTRQIRKVTWGDVSNQLFNKIYAKVQSCSSLNIPL